MPAVIAASTIRTCLGNGSETFAALLEGQSGLTPLCYFNTDALNVRVAYQIVETAEEQLFRASRWLASAVCEVLTAVGANPERQRVTAIVGTGLRELRAVEKGSGAATGISIERLHFGPAIHEISPRIEVITLANACSASGHALALAQDLIESDAADVAIAAGVDAITESMLAMTGRFVDSPVDCVRPFDVDRTGTLLGEGVAAVAVMPATTSVRPVARLMATGLSCDAHHETAPNVDGMKRAMTDVMSRAHCSPDQVDLVVAHGTGTLLNEPAEASLIRETFHGRHTGPWITAVKGGTGHTSGASSLMSVDVAIRCMRSGVIPPIVGLRTPLPEAEGLRLVVNAPVMAHVRLAAVQSFGFGGVNAVTLIETPGRES